MQRSIELVRLAGMIMNFQINQEIPRFEESRIISEEFQFLIEEMGFREVSIKRQWLYYANRFVRGKLGVEAGFNLESECVFDVNIVVLENEKVEPEWHETDRVFGLYQNCAKYEVLPPPSQKFLGVKDMALVRKHVRAHVKPLHVVLRELQLAGLIESLTSS